MERNEDLRLSLDVAMSLYQERTADGREAQAKLSDISATARSADGLIAVRVGPQGRLASLDLDPLVCERVDAWRLARTITRLAGEAAADAAAQARELTAEWARRLHADGETLSGISPGDLFQLPDDDS